MTPYSGPTDASGEFVSSPTAIAIEVCRAAIVTTPKPYDPSVDAALAARLKRRDADAVGELYDRYSRPLYGAAFRIVGSAHHAEDILQEAFARAWERIEQYDEARGTLFTWMMRIVRNLALDTVKSKSFEAFHQNRSSLDVVDDLGQEASDAYNPEMIGVRETLGRLEPELQEVVEALYFRGCTQSEAAEELDLPIGTVKTRVRRAIGKLRDLLRDDVDDLSKNDSPENE